MVGSSAAPPPTAPRRRARAGYIMEEGQRMMSLATATPPTGLTLREKADVGSPAMPGGVREVAALVVCEVLRKARTAARGREQTPKRGQWPKRSSKTRPLPKAKNIQKAPGGSRKFKEANTRP
jgi:hypothetical protein